MSQLLLREKVKSTNVRPFFFSFSNEISSISLESEPWEPFTTAVIYFVSKQLSFFSMKRQRQAKSSVENMSKAIHIVAAEVINNEE